MSEYVEHYHLERNHQGYRTRGEEAAAVVREVEALGRRAIAVGADVSREPDVDRLFAEVTAALGPIDVLVSNAGIANPATIDTLDLARWDEAMTVNLRSAFLVSTKVIASMRARRSGPRMERTATLSHRRRSAMGVQEGCRGQVAGS